MVNTALQQYTEILGTDHVRTGSGIDGYSQCTSGVARQIGAVLLPDSVEQVQEIVRIAGEHKTPLYPISTGKNWGYGSANPAVDGSVIVELSRMNRIIELDEELGTVTVEPGVTQGQLYEYLKERNLSFYAPITGSSPDCSLIGNALERGFGIVPIADHFMGVNSLHAVLPDGSLYKPLMEQMGGHQSQRIHKWGLGPYLDGLFSQGNAGIVTQATIQLAPNYQGVMAFAFRILDEASLLKLIDASRELQSRSGLTYGNIKFFNSRYLMAANGIVPENIAPAGLMSPDILAAMEKKHRLDAWTGVGAVYGDPVLMRSAKKLIRNSLGAHSKQLIFATESRVKKLEAISRFMPSKVASQVSGLRKFLNYQHGIPSEDALQAAYWKSGSLPSDKGNIPCNRHPAHDRCGVMWYVPAIPFSRGVVADYIAMVETTCTEHGIEPVSNFTNCNHACLYGLVMLLFDKEVQLEAAAACRKKLVERGRDEFGILPYRMNIDEVDQHIDQLPSQGARQLMSDIKQSIDPNHIIAPGRYSAV